jgi:hypothetical protein
VLINGRKRPLSITGITLSPEYVYAIGPGDMVPDQRRYRRHPHAARCLKAPMTWLARSMMFR